jgi:hypothetical protein
MVAGVFSYSDQWLKGRTVDVDGIFLRHASPLLIA